MLLLLLGAALFFLTVFIKPRLLYWDWLPNHTTRAVEFIANSSSENKAHQANRIKGGGVCQNMGVGKNTVVSELTAAAFASLLATYMWREQQRELLAPQS